LLLRAPSRPGRHRGHGCGLRWYSSLTCSACCGGAQQGLSWIPEAPSTAFFPSSRFSCTLREEISRFLFLRPRN
jgi:hypothetical protein